MITRPDYRTVHYHGAIKVYTPCGDIETFSDELIAEEWIRLDMIERNRKEGDNDGMDRTL